MPRRAAPKAARPWMLALGAVVVLVALATPSASAHGPSGPAPEGSTRILVDQNDDWLSQGKGHDLLAVDVAEVWVPEERDARILFRMVVDSHTPTLDAAGEVWETFNITIGDRTVTPRLYTDDDATFTHHRWEYVGEPVRESDLYGPDAAGHGEWSIQLGLDYGGLDLSVEDVAASPVNLTAFDVVSRHEADRLDRMVGGAWRDPAPLTGQQEFVEESSAEQEEPVATQALPYQLRGPGRWIRVDASVPSIEVEAEQQGTFRLVLRNLLNATNQSMEVDAISVPGGWNVTFDEGPHVVCGMAWSTGGNCEVVVPVNVTPASDAGDGLLELEVLGRFGDLPGTTRATVRVGLFRDQPAEEHLAFTALDIEPGVTRATVTWTTTLNATSEVRFGRSFAYTDKVEHEALVRKHEVVLRDLEPATTYHMRVVSARGDQRIQTLDTTFNTSALPEVRFLSPASGATVRGEVQVAVEAEGWDGALALRVDDAPLATFEPGDSTVHTWDTTATGDGARSLLAFVEDAVAAELEVVVDNEAGDPGSLRAGEVSPPHGTPDTRFRFAVTFRDLDGDPPSAVEVRIDGAAPRAMQAGSGDPVDGVDYTLATTLPLGEHTFTFQATMPDGTTLQLPRTGTFPGPSVTETGEAPDPGDGSGGSDGSGTGTPGGEGDGSGNGEGSGGSGSGPGDGSSTDGGAGTGNGDGGGAGTGAGGPDGRRGFLGLPGPAAALTVLAAGLLARAFRPGAREGSSRRRDR